MKKLTFLLALLTCINVYSIPKNAGAPANKEMSREDITPQANAENDDNCDSHCLSCMANGAYGLGVVLTLHGARQCYDGSPICGGAQMALGASCAVVAGGLDRLSQQENRPHSD